MTPEERNAMFGNPEPLGICSAETCDKPALYSLGVSPLCAAHMHAFREKIKRDRAARGAEPLPELDDGRDLEAEQRERNLATIFDWLGLS